MLKRGVQPAAGVAMWTALIVVAHVWGRVLADGDARIRIGAPPLFGRVEVAAGPGIAVAAAVAAAVVLWGPRVVSEMSWRGLLWAAIGAAFVWSCGLALGDGFGALAAPLEGRHEYLAVVAEVVPGEFVRTFTDGLAGYPIHVQGHPPGFVLVLWGLGAVGLPGSHWAALLVVLAGASSVAAVLVTVRAVVSEEAARASALYLVLTPAALWVATSADAFFLGVSAWGIALLAVAATVEHGDAFAIAGGLLLGAALHLSYGVAPLGLLALSVLLVRRRMRPLVAAAFGIAVVVAAFAVAGFWWVSGFEATVARYGAGVARFRPYAYFLVAAPAAFAIALGPVAGAGIACVRDRRTWMIVGPVVLAVATATLSGLSKGEVERIWLPFAPWMLVAACALGVRRGWLAAQAGWALGLQTLVRTPW